MAVPDEKKPPVPPAAVPQTLAVEDNDDEPDDW